MSKFKVFDKQFRFNVDIVKSEGDIDGDFYVEGYASTSDLDRQGDIILQEALQAAAKDLEEINSTVFYGHNYDLENAVGKLIKVTIDDIGLRTKIYVSKWAKELRTKLKEGIINKYSIGGRVLQDRQIPKNEALAQGIIEGDVPFDQINIIESIELFEVSFVGVPANPNAQVVGTFAKALRGAYTKDRGEGQGNGGSRQGDGGADKCVCPKCGEEIEHTKGEPCNKVKCPKCDTLMQGKSNKENKDEGGVGMEKKEAKIQEEKIEKTPEEKELVEAPKEEATATPEDTSKETLKEDAKEASEEVKVEATEKEESKEAPEAEESKEESVEEAKEEEATKEPEEEMSEEEIKDLVEEEAKEVSKETSEEEPKKEAAEEKAIDLKKLLEELATSIKELSTFIKEKVKTIEVSAEKKSVVKKPAVDTEKKKEVTVDEEFLGLLKGDTNKIE